MSHCVAEPLCRQSHVPKHVNCVDSRQLRNLHGGSKLATPPYRLTSSLVDNIIMPRRMVALSDTVIRPSVCPSPGYSTLAAWRSCLGYRHAGCSWPATRDVRTADPSAHRRRLHRGKTQRLPRFLGEYRGEVPGCPGGVGAYEIHTDTGHRDALTTRFNTPGVGQIHKRS